MLSLDRTLLHKVLVFAVADQHALLVMDGEPQGDGAGGPPRLRFADLEHRIERVAAIDRLQEARRLLEETDQRVADNVRKDAGAGRTLDRHLQAMRQQVTMTVGLAVFPIVVDRMVVAARELESREQRFGLGTRIYVEPSPDPQVLEPMRRPETVRARIEWGFRHFRSPCFINCRQLSSGQLGFHPFTRSATASRPQTQAGSRSRVRSR